jgi:hypothetical protein
LTDNSAAEPWQIVIGGWSNTRSCIRKGVYSEVTSANTPAILSGTGFKEFWISWTTTRVEVGQVCVSLRNGDDPEFALHLACFCSSRGAAMLQCWFVF